MLTLQTSFYAMSLCLCLFAGTVALNFRSRFPIRYFLIFLCITGLSAVSEWLMTHPTTPYKSLWLLWTMVLALLVAPCLWMFARDLSTDQVPLKPLNSWAHGLPIGLGLLFLLPMVSGIHAGTGFVNLVNPQSERDVFFMQSAMLLMVAVFLLQSLYYTQRCTKFICRRLTENKSLFAQTSDPGVNTLRVLVLVVVANTTLNMMRVFYCGVLDNISFINLSFAFIQTGLTAYLCFSVVAHAISYQQENQTIRHELFNSNSESAIAQPRKYQHSSLDNRRRANILTKLETLFEHEKCYRNNRLNLSLLCKQIGELPYLVSQVINESEYTNFYTLINYYRVTEAQLLLRQDLDKPILDIAYIVGYNSKSSFNTAFKKHVGFSPSAYRAQGTSTLAAPQLKL